MIHQHLCGEDAQGKAFVAGVYPMLLDETCFFLAIDFDKQDWMKDVQAVRDTCKRLGVPELVERSRSGNGAHLWIFFEEAIPAVLARKLGSYILTLTMERRPEIGLDSYDRLFPSQDTLPKGGFGNLIALPLQKKPREAGNSVFVDDAFNAYPDQWLQLSGTGRVGVKEVVLIVSHAEQHHSVIPVRFPVGDDEETPWNIPPSKNRSFPLVPGDIPKSIEMVLGNQVYVAKDRLSPALRSRIIRLAAFQNPEFYKAQAMRFPTFDKPRVISCAEDCGHHIGLPRGCLDELLVLCRTWKIKPILRDERVEHQHVEFSFKGTLRAEQQLAAEALAAHENGVLAATTAFGKTVVAAWLIAQRGVPTLILVHRKQLMEQWVDRLSFFLGIPQKEIGRFGGGRRKVTGLLDVALIQSMVRKGVVNDLVGQYGHVVFDECHHLPAVGFEQVARQAKARFITGLSATVTRKDGHQPIIFMQCGPIRYRVDAKSQAASRPFSHSVIVRPTAFHAPDAGDMEKGAAFHDLYRLLVEDRERNELICKDVLSAVAERRSPVVITERTGHLKLLADRLSSAGVNLVVLQGGMRRKEYNEAMEKLRSVPDRETRLLLATGSFLGEGFDDARLDTLFLTMPVSWRGTIAQYAGRLHRLYDGKREVKIYDYADINVPVLARMFDRRCRGYEAIGYRIQLPADAVPGWPTEVPLPVDPQWKHDYAASVQRLIRDGVDTDLGNLFVHAARKYQADAEGEARARSASEAFLYRRLETLNETTGQFRLNALLPIPFDGRGQMEVDFCCQAVRLAVELDGPQHLSDTTAYRRDRRKDALLQENGYFVLRFLAEDIGKELDTVLDRIVRTLAFLTRVRRQDCKPVESSSTVSPPNRSLRA